MLIGLLIGNMFESPKRLREAVKGPRGGDRGYVISGGPKQPHLHALGRISRRRVDTLKRIGFLDGDLRPTTKATLWYQEVIRE